MKQASATKITPHQLYLTYSYDFLAVLTSMIAMGFVLYSIYLSKIANLHTSQGTLVTLVILNFACIIASFLFKHKLDKMV